MNIQLSQFINYVYPFLDDRSRGRLARTSKEMSQCDKLDRFYRKLATFILKNYNIIAASLPENRLHELFFQATPLLLMGEIHSVDSHRFLNAQLINILWSEHSELFTEGSSERLNQWKKSETHHGILTYLRQEIRVSAQSWDSDIHITHSLHPILNHTKEVLTFTQLVLDFFSRTFSYKKLMSFIEKFPEVFKTEFNQILEMDLFKSPNLSAKERSVLRKKIISEMCKALVKVIGQQKAELDSMIYNDSVFRNQSLVQHISNIFRGVTKAGFFLGGRAHMTDHSVIDPIKEMKKSVPSHFVVLDPKEFVSHLSITKDLRDLFPRYEVSASQVHPNLASHKYEQLTAIMYKDEPLTSNEVEYLKIQLFDMDPEAINASDHHFGVWGEICLLVLKHIADQA